MSPDILVVKGNNGYRVLHGYLHLTNMLRLYGEAIAKARGEGKVKLVKAKDGIWVEEAQQKLPLLL